MKRVILRALVAASCLGALALFALTRGTRKKGFQPLVDSVQTAAVQAPERIDGRPPRVADLTRATLQLLDENDNKPVAGARVEYTCDSRTTEVLTSDLGGIVVLPARPPLFSAKITHADYLERLLTPDEVPDAGNVEIVLTPLGSLLVHVESRGGIPRAGVQVEYLRQITGIIRYSGETDGAGNLTVFGIPRGRRVPVWVGGEPFDVRIPLNRSSGRLNVLREGGATIIGRVVAEDEMESVSGLQVTYAPLLNPSFAPTISSSTRPDGRFVLQGVTDGIGELELGVDGVESVRVQVVGEETTDVGDLRLPSMGRLEGRLFASASVIANSSVTAIKDARRIAVLPLQPDGSFEGRLPKGRVLVVAEARAAPRSTRIAQVEIQVPDTRVVLEVPESHLGTLVVRCESGGTVDCRFSLLDILSVQLEVTSPRSFLRSSTVSNGLATFEGLLPGTYDLSLGTDLGGAFLEHVCIRPGDVTWIGPVDFCHVSLVGELCPSGTREILLSSLNGSREYSVNTDDDGTYRLNGLFPDRYRLKVGGQYRGLRVIRCGINPDLGLGAGPELAGKVVGALGEPVAGIDVVLRRMFSNASESTSTLEDGSFSFLALRPGRYTVFVGGVFYRVSVGELPPALLVVHLARVVRGTLLLGGGPVQDFSDVQLWCVDAGSPYRAAHSWADPTGKQGEFSVSMPAGRAIVACKIRIDDRVRVCLAFTDVPEGGEPFSVDLTGETLEVSRSDHRGLAPKLILDSIPEGNLTDLTGGYAAITPRCSSDARTWLFEGLPHGAQGRLLGYAGNGLAVDIRVRVDWRGTRFMDDPFEH